MPVLASITRQEYFKLRKLMSDEEHKNKIWINTDDNKVEWFSNFPTMFSFSNLKSKLTEVWDQLRKAIKRQKRYNSDDSEVIHLSRKICTQVSRSLIEHIFVHMQDWITRAKQKELLPANIV